MGLFSVNATDLAFACYAQGGGWTDYNSTTLKPTSGFAGTGQYKDFTILRFTVPEFVGVKQKVTFSLGVYDGASSTATPYYAVCTSDSNKSLYECQNVEVADENQIASGTLNFTGIPTSSSSSSSNVKTYTFDIDVDIAGGKTYYLFIWGSTRIRFQTAAYQAVIVSYISGAVHIDNGTEIKRYQCYIDTGTVWKLMLAYIDNGASWDLCS